MARIIIALLFFITLSQSNLSPKSEQIIPIPVQNVVSQEILVNDNFGVLLWTEYNANPNFFAITSFGVGDKFTFNAKSTFVGNSSICAHQLVEVNAYTFLDVCGYVGGEGVFSSTLYTVSQKGMIDVARSAEFTVPVPSYQPYPNNFAPLASEADPATSKGDIFLVSPNDFYGANISIFAFNVNTFELTLLIEDVPSILPNNSNPDGYWYLQSFHTLPLEDGLIIVLNNGKTGLQVIAFVYFNGTALIQEVPTQSIIAVGGYQGSDIGYSIGLEESSGYYVSVFTAWNLLSGTAINSVVVKAANIYNNFATATSFYAYVTGPYANQAQIYQLPYSDSGILKKSVNALTFDYNTLVNILGYGVDGTYIYATTSDTYKSYLSNLTRWSY